MLRSLNSIFRIPELKRKILFTAALLAVYRLGSHIPAPGVSAKVLTSYFQQQANSLLGIYNMFSGGNLSKMTIFALGIMPYISASIILQLLMAVFPFFEKLKKEGEAGKKKITQYTRYGTVLLAIVQGFGISKFMESIKVSIDGRTVSAVPNQGLGFELMTVITLTAGTIFIMWLGEQITERGIGNGISLIIFAGIVARAPAAIAQLWQKIQIDEINIVTMLFILALMILITASVVVLTQGTRKIPVQYPRRIVGRKVMGGQATFLPLKVNSSGVIPIIFAQAIMSFPTTIATFAGSEQSWLTTVTNLFSPGSLLYTVLYSLFIIFFAYFYTAIILNPIEVADNMKKYGGFIPGIRPGRKTAEYIDSVISRITLPGAIFLAAIAVLPVFLMQKANLPFYFGGTALLIVVGVSLDTLQQIESHLLMRHYDGFMKRGKLRGRR